jgi:hypothetical protein
MGCDEVQGYLFGRPESKVREMPQRPSSSVNTLNGVAALMRSDHIPGCIEISAPVKIETELVDLPPTGDTAVFSGSELAQLLPAEPVARAERRKCPKASISSDDNTLLPQLEFPLLKENSIAS